MRTRLATAAVFLALAAPIQAQTSFVGEAHRDLNTVQKKFIDLANAIPESAYGWHPEGARTVAEVLLHVASENYYLPIAMGTPAPAASHITSDYASTGTFEKRKLTKAQVIADLTASFQHLHKAITPNTDANLGEKIKWFGQDATRQSALFGTVTHLHEHLGQLIAYARANNVVPPWSK
jgi:uncharacterized damage-inducible protein DinB